MVWRTQTWWASLSHLLAATGTVRAKQRQGGERDILQVIKTPLMFHRGGKWQHVRNWGENLEHMFGICNNLICSPKTVLWERRSVWPEEGNWRELGLLAPGRLLVKKLPEETGAPDLQIFPPASCLLRANKGHVYRRPHLAEECAHSEAGRG